MSNSQNVVTAPSATVQRYPLHTYGVPRQINLKQIMELLYPGVVERYSPDCVVLHIGNAEKLFIYKFGAVVFFNVPTGAHENYLKRLGLVPQQRPQPNTAENDYSEDEVAIRVEPGVTNVGFNVTTIPEFDLGMIQLVSMVLAQSSALELIEWEVETFLARSEELTGYLKGRIVRRSTRGDVLKFIGQGLETKHRIFNQLVLLNEPEKTWEKEEIYKLYADLYANFDLRDRLEKLDKMLNLSTEVSELILEHVNAQRSELLEIVIILLIAFEIIKSFM